MAQQTPTPLVEDIAAVSAPIAQISGSAIAEVKKLAREGGARVEFFELPVETLPDSALLAEQPALVVLIGTDGKPEIRSLKADIDAYRTKPAFREGTATATTLASFIDLVNRHANNATAIFVDANWKAPKLLAVIDYHLSASPAKSHGPEPERQDPSEGEDALARFGRHRIAYAFPLSEPWKTWVEKDGKFMEQGDFAAFLEDHIHELAAPELSLPAEAELEQRFKTTIAHPSDVMDLARGLDVKVGAVVKNRVKLQSGETNFTFETEHRDSTGRELTVPGLFLLSIPVFYRGEQVRLPVRLRYRVNGGTILWAYQMHRPDEAVDGMVRDDVTQVAAATQLPVYDGAPENRGVRAL